MLGRLRSVLTDITSATDSVELGLGISTWFYASCSRLYLISRLIAYWTNSDRKKLKMKGKYMGNFDYVIITWWTTFRKSIILQDIRDYQEHDAKNRLLIPFPSSEESLKEVISAKRKLSSVRSVYDRIVASQ